MCEMVQYCYTGSTAASAGSLSLTSVQSEAIRSDPVSRFSKTLCGERGSVWLRDPVTEVTGATEQLFTVQPGIVQHVANS